MSEERTRMDQNELTPEEKMAFQRLPKEAEPSRILEERIVRSLRQEGILTPKTQEAGSAGGGGRAARWFKPWMAVASAAASLVLFGSGVVLGQWMGSQSTAQAFIQVREQDAAHLALRIQEAGSAYVSALAALSELHGPGQRSGAAGDLASLADVDLDQGREVALGALYGAANELARMSPEDADVLRILEIMEERRARDEGRGGTQRNVVWF
jgi:hypothetical protein